MQEVFEDRLLSFYVHGNSNQTLAKLVAYDEFCLQRVSGD
jgi:hypothetical protein